MTNKKAKATVAMFLSQVGRKDLIEFDELINSDKVGEDQMNRAEHLKVRAFIIQELLTILNK